LNTLAHLYLSGSDPDLILGNFIGDSIRGAQFEELNPQVQQGVLLHRQIDRYTDAHPVFRRLSSLMREDFGRYCSVVADVFMDHFLAKDWHRYHRQPLVDYTNWVKCVLTPRISAYPARSQRFFDYLSRTDTLLHYRSTSGINQTLSQMAQRTRFDSGMEKSGEVLSRLYPQLQNGFDDFFPQLVAYAERQRQPPTRETKPVNSQAEPALAS